MQFAVNYAPALADLVRQGRVQMDCFKCPDWPDLLEEARQTLPVYIHFPLVVGAGQGGPVDAEQGELADLERIADLLAQTGTPLVNTHFQPSAKDYPDIDPTSRSARDVRRVVDNTLRDLEPLIRRFGAEKVTVENIISGYHGNLTITALPEAIGRIVEQTGCGFLLDLSHARLSARNLGLDARAYCAGLPVGRIREIHVTGLQKMEGALLERLQAAGDPGGFAARLAGRYMDHLAMAPEDWPEVAWMLGEISAGRWQAPWVLAYEYGGVGGFFEVVTDCEAYRSDVPRLHAMLN